MDSARRLLRIERPFWWGAILVGDRDQADVPTGLSESGFGASETAIAIRVRHAQDVEFEDVSPEDVVPPCKVVVTVTTGIATSPVAFERDLAIQSGWLTVGDAESEDEVWISPGRWRVSVSLDDVQFAERVDLWLARIEGVS